MIDVVSCMAEARQNILSYVNGLLDMDSIKWLRELMSDMNKNVLKTGSDDFAASVWPLYKNVLKFFQEYCDEVTAGSVLVTFYISAVELGIRDENDRVKELPQFLEEVDVDDWGSMGRTNAVLFDMVMCSTMTNKWINPEGAEGIVWAGGLHTLSAVGLM